jgi:hypothetical protein
MTEWYFWSYRGSVRTWSEYQGSIVCTAGVSTLVMSETVLDNGLGNLGTLRGTNEAGVIAVNEFCR